MRFPVDKLRAKFPALTRATPHGDPVIYFDGPAGSQVPVEVADAVRDYLLRHNANTGGAFATSRESDDRIADARRAVAEFLGTDAVDSVIFGLNMPTLTFALSRSLPRPWSPGDELVVTRLDHDANVTPWRLAARDAGATVRTVGIRSEDCTLDLDELTAALTRRTRLLAVGAASNAVGTINPIAAIAERAHQVGAELFVDAVHYAPHGLIDVAAWDCDYVACSAYKFFGPHVGILWGRPGKMAALPTYQARPAGDTLPGRWSIGTQSHEGIVGTGAAIGYLEDLGRQLDPTARGRRAALVAAYDGIAAYEGALTHTLLARLAEIPAFRVWGIRAAARSAERVPTFAITHARIPPAALAAALAERGIFVWSGNYYALELMQSLCLEPTGALRIGFLHYNTVDEIERLAAALRAIDTNRS